jgi:hypothetical protein
MRCFGHMETTTMLASDGELYASQRTTGHCRDSVSSRYVCGWRGVLGERYSETQRGHRLYFKNQGKDDTTSPRVAAKSGDADTLLTGR